MTQSGILVDEFTEKDFNFSQPTEECRIETSESPQNVAESRNELDFSFRSVNFQENADSAIEEVLTTSTQDDESNDESESNFSDAPNSNPIHSMQDVTNEMDTDAFDSSIADSVESFQTENVSEKDLVPEDHVAGNESDNTVSDVSKEINSTVTNLENIENEHNLDLNNKENTKNVTEDEIVDNNSETIQDKTESTSEVNSNKRKRSDDSSDNAEDCGRLMPSKQLKETEEKESSCNDNAKPLQPIPFEDGVPKKSMRCRKEFRLPCHINLLKHGTVRTSQRKSTKGTKKLTKTANNKLVNKTKSNDTKNKNGTEKSGLKSATCSSDRSLPERKKDDYDEFRKLFEENIRQLQSPIRYEPVTTLTNDLLGFHPTNNKNKHSSDSSSEGSARLPITSDTHSSRCVSPASSTCSEDTVDSPPPDLTTSSENKSVPTHRETVDNLGKAIKDKIKEIYQELDILTDEDQKIAKWHEELKPRLDEAERKPPFRIHDYESRIIKKLETRDRKLDFEEIIREESPSEIARYFSATLQLASSNNLNINPVNDPNLSIELILLE